MKFRADPHFRRRQTIELANLVCRAAGAGGNLAFLVSLMDPGRGPQPSWLPAICAINVLIMTGTCALTVINFARPDGPRYRLYGILQVAVDTAATCGGVLWLEMHGDQIAWPLVIIPVVVAAQRLLLRSTLVVGAIAAGVVLAGILTSARLLTEGGTTPVAIPVILIVAALCGAQSNASARQVAQLQQAHQQLEHQAGHDALTGLPNRSSVERYAASLDGRGMAVLLLDLDGFKQVNDSLGHAAGDAVLIQTGRRMKGLLRGTDMPGRLGGDEFIVLLPDADAAAAEVLAQRLRASICQPVDVGAEVVQVGVSIGVACRASGNPAGVEQLTAAADVAMYRDKHPVRP
ncbi:GGDEF domain-containing protein [Actinoplanes subtropicus]|uniref:GGDEF domain-containing protein n=1 Tax=Actinoplanes subtropicus TaxID=543632 RepID=UPI000A01CDF2|nr:GGDEF domain-containing protein [Actinoplanes subtropicus]